MNVRKSNECECAETESPQRPWNKQDAQLWWVTMFLSLGIMAWSCIDGWVLNPRIERMLDAGTVVSAQVKDNPVQDITLVSTNRLVVPLAGAATLAVGEPMRLQQRASGRYYLCDHHQHCYPVHSDQVSESLSNWQTPQALGVSDHDPNAEVPSMDILYLGMWLMMFFFALNMTRRMRPFGPGKEKDQEKKREQGQENPEQGGDQ